MGNPIVRKVQQRTDSESLSGGEVEGMSFSEGR